MEMNCRSRDITRALPDLLEDEITTLRKCVAALEKERNELEANSEEWEQEYYKVCKERDKAHQYWQIAEGRCDALIKQRDELVAALEKLTDVFANIGITSGLYDDEQDALKAACDVIASTRRNKMILTEQEI